MENKYYYRITLKIPETGIVIENDIILNKEVSIYSIPQIAIDKGVIKKEDIDNITSVTKIDEKDSKELFYQAEQMVLKPRDNYGTGKQFSHLMKDLQITDKDYVFMIDIGKITKNEITIVIYPNKFKDMENMAKSTISQIIRILNLNSTKIVSVNYILSESLGNNFTDNEKNNTYTCDCDDNCNKSCCTNDCNNECCINHPDNPEYKHGDPDKCDCDIKCLCFHNPDLECCKSCDMTEDCGCYIQKRLRNEYSYNIHNSENSNSDPEKTLRIPVNPVNPKDEIIMLANAIAKRLVILSPTDGKVVIEVEKCDDEFESTLEISTSDHSYYTLSTH